MFVCNVFCLFVLFRVNKVRIATVVKLLNLMTTTAMMGLPLLKVIQKLSTTTTMMVVVVVTATFRQLLVTTTVITAQRKNSRKTRRVPTRRKKSKSPQMPVNPKKKRTLVHAWL